MDVRLPMRSAPRVLSKVVVDLARRRDAAKESNIAYVTQHLGSSKFPLLRRALKSYWYQRWRRSDGRKSNPGLYCDHEKTEENIVWNTQKAPTGFISFCLTPNAWKPIALPSSWSLKRAFNLAFWTMNFELQLGYRKRHALQFIRIRERRKCRISSEVSHLTDGDPSHLSEHLIDLITFNDKSSWEVEEETWRNQSWKWC